MAFEKSIEIPENVKASLDGKTLEISGEKGSLKKTFDSPYAKLELDQGEAKVKGINDRRKIKALVGTWIAIIRNMITGVTEGYEYKLKIHYNHFPMSAKVDGNKFIISNYLGEKGDLVAEIPEGVQVKTTKEEVFVSGIDKELIGITAGRIEQLCKPKGRDRRKFLDGIYLVKKAK